MMNSVEATGAALRIAAARAFLTAPLISGARELCGRKRVGAGLTFAAERASRCPKVSRSPLMLARQIDHQQPALISSLGAGTCAKTVSDSSASICRVSGGEQISAPSKASSRLRARRRSPTLTLPDTRQILG